MAHLHLRIRLDCRRLAMLAGIKCAIEAGGIAIKASTPLAIGVVRRAVPAN